MLRILAWLSASLLGLVALFALPDWGALKGEITNYQAQCDVSLVNGNCSSHAFTLRPTTYKVNSETQDVIYWTEGFDPARLTRCAIASRTNWSCTYSDDSARIGFRNGVYFEEASSQRDFDPNKTTLPGVTYVLPRWKFLWYRTQGK